MESVRAYTGPVGTPPVIRGQPQSQRVVEGEDVLFTVSVSSDSPVTFQWKKDGVPLPGETMPTLELASVGPEDEGLYKVVVYNTAGHLPSEEAQLTVLPSSYRVRFGSVWRYWDQGFSPGAGWQQLGFDDGAWRSGAAELGYGDGDEATVVSYGPDANNKFVTTYFRQRFLLETVEGITNAVLQLRRDDGAIVYLNGTEILRSNVPDGSVGYGTYAATRLGGNEENAIHTAPIDAGRFLVEGLNVIAVEVHQAAPSSSDLSFDLEFRIEARAPMGALDLTFDPGAGPNGPVCDLLMQPLGGIVLAGRFDLVDGEERLGIARLHPDGTLDLSFGAGLRPDGPVVAVDQGPNEELLVAGGFRTLNGQPAHGFAVLDPETGATLWAHTGPLAGVASLGVIGSSIYLAGDFPGADQTPRWAVAKYDPTLRQLAIWKEFGAPLHRVWATRLAVYVTGDFDDVDGLARDGLVALNPNTGEANTWDLKTDKPVLAFADNSVIQYFGGQFTTLNGVGLEGIAAVEFPANVVEEWDVGLSGEVRAATLVRGVLYLGGEFISASGSRNLAAVPIDGPLRHEFGLETRSNDAVRALEVQPDGNVLVAGDFTRVNGVSRPYIARLYGRPPVEPDDKLWKPTLTVYRREPGCVRVRVVAFPGYPASIQASTNVRDWEPVLNKSGPTGIYEFKEPDPERNPFRFYRAMRP